jgi:phosphatidylserine decarboxylase
MADAQGRPLSEHRRLGGWLPRKEAELAAFIMDLRGKAKERAGEAPRVSAREELTALITGDRPSHGPDAGNR